MAVIDNKVFKQTLIEYLEYKEEDELAQLMKPCDFILTDTGQFTYSVWNQTKVELDVRAPLSIFKKIEEYWDRLKLYFCEVYPDDREHALFIIVKGVKMVSSIDTESDDNNETITSYSGGQVYENLISKVHKNNIDDIEKDYIIEACYCAQNNYRLAAATMIGCAAERLLYQLCNAYLAYLQNGNGTDKEISNFETKVVNAKKAHARLDGFKRTVQNSEKLFEKIGLENSNLHFSFLDIIRQVRNESGHPTGVKVSSEDLSSIFANYQLLIQRVHPIITKLPTYNNDEITIE